MQKPLRRGLQPARIVSRFPEGRIMWLSAAMLACGWSRINDRLEVLQWIERPSVDADLKQQVRTRAKSRTADLSDHLAILHNLTDPDGDDREVRVPGRHSIPVIDHDQSPVTGLISRHGHAAGSGGEDGAARWSADIDARMHLPRPEDGVLAKSKSRGHATARRPEESTGNADR